MMAFRDLLSRVYHPHWTMRRCLLCHRPVRMMADDRKGKGTFVGLCEHCGATAEVYVWNEGLLRYSEFECRRPGP